MRTAGIHGEELPVYIKEADIRVVAKRGVQEAAALLSKLRGWLYEPPCNAFRVPFFISGARSHHNSDLRCFCHLRGYSPRFSHEWKYFCVFATGKCSIFTTRPGYREFHPRDPHHHSRARAQLSDITHAMCHKISNN